MDRKNWESEKRRLQVKVGKKKKKDDGGQGEKLLAFFFF